MIKTKGQFVDFIESVFGKGVFSNGGKNISVVCPFCLRKKGKFYTNKKLVIRTDNGINHCWVCDYKSRDLLFLMKVFYPEFVNVYVENFLNNKTIISQEDDGFLNEGTLKPVLPPGSKLLIENLNEKEYYKYKLYLKARGIYKEKDYWYWKFLVSDSGDFKNRVIIPSFDKYGELNYYCGRHIFIKNGFNKYKNCSYDKESIIFNEININWSKPLTIVEGPFDLIKCNENATCILGSSLGTNNLLFQQIIINSTPVVISLDKDAEKKAFSIASKFIEYNIDTFFISQKDDKDVGDMNQEEFAEMYLRKIKLDKKDLLLYKIRNINL